MVSLVLESGLSLGEIDIIQNISIAAIFGKLAGNPFSEGK